MSKSPVPPGRVEPKNRVSSSGVTTGLFSIAGVSRLTPGTGVGVENTPLTFTLRYRPNLPARSDARYIALPLGRRYGSAVLAASLTLATVRMPLNATVTLGRVDSAMWSPGNVEAAIIAYIDSPLPAIRG